MDRNQDSLNLTDVLVTLRFTLGIHSKALASIPAGPASVVTMLGIDEVREQLSDELNNLLEAVNTQNPFTDLGFEVDPERNGAYCDECSAKVLPDYNFCPMCGGSFA